MDSRAALIVVSETEMDDCAYCEVSITSDSDKKWIVANVYTDCCLNPACTKCRGTARRWEKVEHYHPECYEAVDFPYGTPEKKRARRPKAVESEEW